LTERGLVFASGVAAIAATLKALLLSRAAEAFGEARDAKAAADVNLIKVFESFPLVEGCRRRILRTRLYDRLLGKRLRLECTVNEASADAAAKPVRVDDQPVDVDRRIAEAPRDRPD
jgi:hypothetical protein